MSLPIDWALFNSVLPSIFVKWLIFKYFQHGGREAICCIISWYLGILRSQSPSRGTLGKASGQEVFLQWEGVSKIGHDSLEVSVDKQQQAREGSTSGEERGETVAGTRGLTWAVWGGHTVVKLRKINWGPYVNASCGTQEPTGKAMTLEPGNSPQYSSLQNCKVEFYSCPHILGKEKETRRSQLTSSGITQQSSLRSRQLGAHLFKQSCSPPSGRAIVTQGKSPIESNRGACGGGVGTIGRHREEDLEHLLLLSSVGNTPMTVSAAATMTCPRRAGTRQIVWGRCCARPVEHSL